LFQRRRETGQDATVSQVAGLDFEMYSSWRALNENNIEIEDLSAVPTNLEEIFLKVVEDSDASNN